MAIDPSLEEEVWGRGGGAEKAFDSVSAPRIASSEDGCSQGGGTMLARRWRFSRRASQRGRAVRWGGWRGVVGPYDESLLALVYLIDGAIRTD
jgi:hypothetical protein